MPTITLSLSDDLVERISEEARLLGMTPEERVVSLLDRAIAPAENFRPGAHEQGLSKLSSFVKRIPCVTWLSSSDPSEPRWWIKFGIDVHSKIAWHVAQSLGFVLNELSITERLPTVFKPVSPPPYLNGGPVEFLSWVVEATIPFLDAGYIADVLEGRLPNPVDEEERWLEVDDESDAP